MVDGGGYPIYKRSKKGVRVKKDGVPLGKEFVIPYNSQLLLKYRAHINVEWYKSSMGVSQFLNWMGCNSSEQRDMQVAKELLYCQFPTKFVWKKKERQWSLRKKKGPKCFKDIRTIDEDVCPTFREARYKLGLIGDDREYIDAIKQAADWGSGFYLRNLFPTLLQSALQLTDEELKNYALIDIENSLQLNGSSLTRFQGMPLPDSSTTSHHRNTLVMDALSYDQQSLREENERQLSSMTDEQSKGKIVVAVASSGIAATLIPSGVTAHSRLSIPLNVNEDSSCSRIKPGRLADEAPMTHKHSFEAVDKSLKDVMRVVNERNVELPFGGKVVVFGGDFRQTLPVVSKGSRADVVRASLCSSYLWPSCKVLRLTKNMRLQVGRTSDNVADPIASIVNVTYPDLQSQLWNPDHLQERAILAPTHKIVEAVDDYVLSKIDEDEVIYLSSDEVSNDDRGMGDPDLHSTEYLNSIKCSGLPNHQLKLKVGDMVMLLRDIDQSRGLCNGTRLIVTDLASHVIRCTVLTGSHKGDHVHIARLTLTPSDSIKFPVRFSRRQFPIAVCFAMTINKSQG
ncbi:uncharacterized protein LOC141659014 [Silene latifolia]|uniref:uncharacterized protein LOC141659014 n=1 Tax=Silene latifolia TaxID=37657 RepID=UPI003D7762EA